MRIIYPSVNGTIFCYSAQNLKLQAIIVYTNNPIGNATYIIFSYPNKLSCINGAS